MHYSSAATGQSALTHLLQDVLGVPLAHVFEHGQQQLLQRAHGARQLGTRVKELGDGREDVEARIKHDVLVLVLVSVRQHLAVHLHKLHARPRARSARTHLPAACGAGADRAGAARGRRRGAHLPAAVDRKGLNVLADTLHDLVDRHDDVHSLDDARHLEEVTEEVAQNGLDLLPYSLRRVERLDKVTERVHRLHLRRQVPAGRHGAHGVRAVAGTLLWQRSCHAVAQERTGPSCT